MSRQSISAAREARPRRRRGSFERAIVRRLATLRHGQLELRYNGARHRFGAPAADGLAACLTVNDERFFRRLALGGSLGAAESYMDGDWDCDDLTALVRLLVRNLSLVESMESGLARAAMWVARTYHERRRNTRDGSRRNIHAHYDLGNDLFERMLDSTMTYSSAIFADETSTLEQASVHKLDLLCRELELGPDDHLLEIGSGWGSMAIHAASRYGCRVTTTTISEQQHAEASARVAAAGLSDRVRVLKEDYRDLVGRYDKIVSVEMIEAVGADFYTLFFERCAQLLRPGGKFAMQAITIADQHFERARDEADFIKRYIFPGSCIPSVTALLDAATAGSDLRLRNVQDYTPHYARTLAAWRDRLLPHRAWVEERYGERFWRMWLYYLAYCEGGFSERYIGLVQMVFDRSEWST